MNNLRRTIKQLILEATRENQLKDLALFHHEASNKKHYYLLFHPSLAEDIINVSNHWAGSSSEFVIKALAESKHIYGMIIARPPGEKSFPCLGSWEIILAAAKSGWGPTMYDIVMGDSPNGIMSDREQVTKHAKPLYDFYYKNREDVEKIALDDKDHHYTPRPKDDCTWGSDGDYKAYMVAVDEESDGRPTKKNLWYADTLNYVYNREKTSHRAQMEDNYFNAIKELQYWDILNGSNTENFVWWRKVMHAFFDEQDKKRNYG
tara:strand:- start:941 stop:1726 length:786 start_codon:yes stop_codon:yes gene_type:complete